VRRMRCKRPRIVIAGERSGVGKSTITVGIMAALRRRGLLVQPFKVGPDYLDPMHHDMVTKRTSRNLDTWMFPQYVPESFGRASAGADISVIEGVMGLFDGYDGISEEGSTAHLSKVLRCPVILVLDASASARSMGAVAKGFAEYDQEVDIEGIIFNNVGGERHLRMLETSLRGMGSLGGLPKDASMDLKSRHLGLVPAAEQLEAGKYEKITDKVEEHIDIERLIQIAEDAPELECPVAPIRTTKERCTIGVAKDAAFNFYYEDNLNILRSLGARVVEFSPLIDKMPDIDGLYLGGGYPEVFAAQLGRNADLLCQVRKASDDEMPIYAECGGMMYMCSDLRDCEGKKHRMTGVFRTEVEMTPDLQAIGYVEAEAVQDCVLAAKGWSTRGHVFHFSKVCDAAGERFAYEVKGNRGILGSADGLTKKNTLASYTHLHFGSCPNFAERFVEACVRWSRK